MTEDKRTISSLIRAQEPPTLRDLPRVVLPTNDERRKTPFPSGYSIIDTDEAICREVERIFADDHAVLVNRSCPKKK